MRAPQRVAVQQRFRSRSRVAVRCALLIAACASLSCLRGSRDVVTARGTTVRRMTARFVAVDGFVLGPSDFVIESEGLRVVVGGMKRPARERGAVLRLGRRHPGEGDPVGPIVTGLRIAAKRYPFVPESMTLVERDGRALLRMEGRVRAGEANYEFHRELTVSDVASVLSARTFVSTDATSNLDAEVSSEVTWGGALPFASLVGTLADEAWHATPWIGREGRTHATVMANANGALRVRASYSRHGASSFLSHTEVASRGRALSRRSIAYRELWSAAAGGMDQAIRRAFWAKPARVPEIIARIPHCPSGAHVEISTEDGRPVVAAKPGPGGRTIVPLLPMIRGRTDAYVARASAYGHAPSDSVRFRVPLTVPLVLVIPEGGQLHVTAVDERNVHLPFRVRVIALGTTRTPDLGPDYRGDGAVDTVVALGGAATFPLQPGRYRVVVTRGPEWTLVTRDVEVTPTFRPHVRAQLSHVVSAGDWVASDFHLHAQPSSDSAVTFHDRLVSLAAEGIRFAVPTDHNHVSDYAPVAKTLGLADFGTVPGVEITTANPNFGHFNAYPVPHRSDQPEHGAPTYLGQTPTSLFRSVRALDPDVVVQVNHPRLEGKIGYFDLMHFDPGSGAAAAEYSDDYDAIEVWNGFDLARPAAFERMFGEWLALLQRGKRVVATGNSDSHTIRYQCAGYPRTYVHVPGGQVDDPRAVVRALKAGHAVVTSGPLLEATVGNQGPGDTAVVRSPRTQLHVRVRAAPWIDVSRIEVYVGGALRHTRWLSASPASPLGVPLGRADDEGAPHDRPVVRFDGELPIPTDEDSFIVVLVRGDKPLDVLFGRKGILPIAFTNPIWIRRDSAGNPRNSGMEHDVPDASQATPLPPSGRVGP